MRPVDILIFGFLFCLISLTSVFVKQVPDAHIILSTYLLLAVALILLILIKKRHSGKSLDFIHNLAYPYVTVVLVFDSLGGLIRHINPVSYDHVLIRYDYLIFGAHPTIALENYVHPVITELLQYAYISYYFLPLILGLALLLRNRDSELTRSIFLVVLCFFLSYIGLNL